MEAVLTYGTLAKMNPPLRTEADRQALVKGLSDGTIDIIATDHAPHSREEKEKHVLSKQFPVHQGDSVVRKTALIRRKRKSGKRM